MHAIYNILIQESQHIYYIEKQIAIDRCNGNG